MKQTQVTSLIVLSVIIINFAITVAGHDCTMSGCHKGKCWAIYTPFFPFAKGSHWCYTTRKAFPDFDTTPCKADHECQAHN